jgi:P-type conjugative transfer protein TrbJ
VLINQARNLASLPTRRSSSFSSRCSARSSSQQAQNIAYDVQQIDQAFQTKYANVSMSASDQQLVADARSRWQNTVGGLQDAMRVQATVVGNIDTNRTQMSALVGASQSATGALQATQAGNQLLAPRRSSSPTSPPSSPPTAGRRRCDAERPPPPNRAANSAAAS